MRLRSGGSLGTRPLSGTRAPCAPRPGSPPAAGKQVWKGLGSGDHSRSRSRRDETLKMEVRVGLVGHSQQLRPARTSVSAPAARCSQPRTHPRGAPSKVTELTGAKSTSSRSEWLPGRAAPGGVSECQKRKLISLHRIPVLAKDERSAYPRRGLRRPGRRSPEVAPQPTRARLSGASGSTGRGRLGAEKMITPRSSLGALNRLSPAPPRAGGRFCSPFSAC